MLQVEHGARYSTVPILLLDAAPIVAADAYTPGTVTFHDWGTGPADHHLQLHQPAPLTRGRAQTRHQVARDCRASSSPFSFSSGAVMPVRLFSAIRQAK